MNIESNKKRTRGSGAIWPILFAAAVWAVFAFVMIRPAHAAGLLKPLNASEDSVHIKSHQVNVTLNNGFARTEVDQVFMNTSDRDLEAVYTFPVPKQASLSELSLWIDGQEVVGEVLEKQKAKEVYEEQRSRGNETALAEKDDYRTFDISVSPVRAHDETRVRLVYYQPIEVDLNVGRYVYPLAEGGVDDERIAFWTVDDKVDGSFRFTAQVKSAFPIKDLRLPGNQQNAVITKAPSVEGEGGDVYDIVLESPEGGSLGEDVVIYYRLDDTVPARVEMVPYRDGSGDGTFMLVVTPGTDLKRITEGTDWIFVLDTSGSMGGQKIQDLIDAVSKSLGQLSPNDRFRIVTFNTRADDFTGGYVVATPENVQRTIERVRSIRASGSTALFEGLKKALRERDTERTAALILVSDGVANVGPTRHQDFLNLIHSQDLRLFTFIMGNSANQPLMETLAKESGGFAMNVSTRDDIVGRLIQAKAKMVNEALYDVQVKFRGGGVKDVTPRHIGNAYIGQQIVVFGHYDRPGETELTVTAKVSGEDKTWKCRFALPDTDTENPEIERLWALASIDEIMDGIRNLGSRADWERQVVGLGTRYSLVTDYTSMVVMRTEEKESRGIQRNNAGRVNRERQAQAARQSAPVRNNRVDQSANNGTGMFQGRHSHGLGSGPVGPLFLGGAWLLGRLRRRRDR